MRCPCGSRTKVIYMRARMGGHTAARKRVCLACDYAFNTVEVNKKALARAETQTVEIESTDRKGPARAVSGTLFLKRTWEPDEHYVETVKQMHAEAKGSGGTGGDK